MRHTTTAVTAALLLALTTACGSSNSDGDGDGEPSGKPSPTHASPRATYLKAAHNIAFTGSGPSDTELADYPPKWCQGLGDGHSAAWLFSSGGGGLYPLGQGWGTVKRNATQLLVAGVKAYCPQHLGTVTAELRASGEY